MFRSQALVESAKARRYLGQLCKHFRHKVPAVFAEDYSSGRVEFDRDGVCYGVADMVADATRLEITASAETAEKLSVVEKILSEHIAQFGWRENPVIHWNRNGQGEGAA
jgi:hypothetical protein